MKLIIDIPEWKYKSICEGVEASKRCGVVGIDPGIHEAIYNGTTLDSVKAEIEKHQFSREYCCDHNIDTAIDMGMVRIILDNIGKESEDK